MKVAFRTDASTQIGTGHVMRCLTLASELELLGHECWFVCRDHPGNLNEVIERHGHGLLMLPASTLNRSQLADSSPQDYKLWLGVSLQEDSRETIEALTVLRPDFLVVDHYALDATWESVLSREVGQVIVIDDLANRVHDCSILLDQNFGRLASDYDGLLPKECQRLMGPHFALVRREFVELRKTSLERRRINKFKRILISMGGVDRTNVTGRVLDVIATTGLPADIELDIVMGGSAPYLDQVRQQSSQLPYNAVVSVNVQDMSKRMCQADLSIGAAGSTSWERCCMGLPAITVVLAENQRSIAETLAKNSASFFLEASEVETGLPRLIAGYAEDADKRYMMAKRAGQICDGLGAQRVASYLDEGFR